MGLKQYKTFLSANVISILEEKSCEKSFFLVSRSSQDISENFLKNNFFTETLSMLDVCIWHAAES